MSCIGGCELGGGGWLCCYLAADFAHQYVYVGRPARRSTWCYCSVARWAGARTDYSLGSFLADRSARHHGGPSGI